MHYFIKRINLSLLLMLLSTTLINAMEKAIPFTRLVEERSSQSSVMTPLTTTESLLDEGNANNRAPLEEVVVELPTINITPPARFTDSTKTGGMLLGAGMAGGYGLGGFIIGVAHDGWFGPTIGTGFLLCGAAATYGMVRLCLRAKQIHTEELADIAAYVPRAQQAVVNHRTLPYHMNIPDAMLNKIYSFSKQGYKETLSVMICDLDAKFQWSAEEEAAKFTEFTPLAQAIADSLPRAEQEQPLPQEELLPISSGLIRETLTHETATLAMKKLIARYPIKFMNRYYHTDCPVAKKASFAEAIAIAATDVHSNNILSLLHSNTTLSESDKRRILVHARNAYFNRITHLEVPTN